MLHIVDWATTDILNNVVLQLQCQKKTLEISAAMYQLTPRNVQEDLNSLLHCEYLKSRKRGADVLP
jgi:hypothetical protein